VVASLHDTPTTHPARKAAATHPSVSEHNLKQRKAVENLFTLYESQHLQMMKITDLLRK
jgi:hypothetical protein